MDNQKNKADDKDLRNFVDMMDSYMGAGGGHLKVNDSNMDILVNNKQDDKSFADLASMSNECPMCANIPNISDVDDAQNQE